jgi:sugar/nucleoside kinase (ribokinase family)
MKSSYEVMGVGAPIMDTLVYVEPEFLDQIPGQKGGMEVVDYEAIVDIIEKSGDFPAQVAGGSASNVIKGLACLGHSCVATGKIGDDALGKKFMDHMADLNIQTSYIFSKTPTARVVSLVTPDGKRTMRCYMGACSEMLPDDLDVDIFQGIKLMHIEGYTLLCPGLTRRAMELAKKAHAKISFDLGSFEMVNNFRDLLFDLIGSYVDIVFGNEDEFEALFGKNLEASKRELGGLCEIAVAMRGEKGCWVGSNGKVEAYPAFPVKPLDTTGAGDLFSSGFLHGYLQKLSMEECARYGAITGGQVVQEMGAEIPSQKWAEIKLKMENPYGSARAN